jgi:hypothetical protein
MTIYDLFKVACIDVNVDLCKDIKTHKELEGVLSNIGTYEFSKSSNNLFLFHKFVELVKDSSFSNLETLTNLILNGLASMSFEILSYSLRSSSYDQYSDYIRDFKFFLADQEDRMVTSYIFINWLLALYPDKEKFICVLEPYINYDTVQNEISALFEPIEDTEEDKSDYSESESSDEDGMVDYDLYLQDADTDTDTNEDEDEDEYL